MAANVIARPQAAQKVFHRVRNNAATLHSCQKAQAAQLRALLGRARFEITDVALVMAELGQVGFDEDSLNDLQRVLLCSATAACPAEVADEGNWQHYTANINYIPDDLWDAMAGFSGPTMLCTFLGHLNCRNPSAPTMQLVTTLLLCQSAGVAQARTFSLESKHEYLNCVKKVFEASLVNLPQPKVELTTLPASPTTLLNNYPDIYHAAFDPRTSGACPIDHVQVESIRSGSWLRSPMGR